jgi:hypothetical protein
MIKTSSKLCAQPMPAMSFRKCKTALSVVEDFIYKEYFGMEIRDRDD